MRVLYGIIVFFALFLLACSDAEREEKRLEGNLLMKGNSSVCYDGIGLTESYLVLLARGCDTIIQVFDKDDLSRLHAFALKGMGASYFTNPEFVKMNTKAPAGKDEIWIADNQLVFTRVSIADSLCFERMRIPASFASTHYNITSKELYAVPFNKKGVLSPFYYMNENDGYYWMEPPKVEKNYRSCMNTAYLPNLCVNERQNSVVAALRFFNQIDFYDLGGTYQRSFTYGKEPIVPLLKGNDTQVDVLGTTKCFIDIFGTDQYVYCLYDGSVDFSNLSTLLVLSWDGKLKKQLNFDRSIKRIAVDSSDRFLVALAQDESGVLDVVKYLL